MKRLVILILAIGFISSCEVQEPQGRERNVYIGHLPPLFSSEEEFVEYARNFDSDTLVEGREWRDEFDIPAPTHYYRLNLPETTLDYIRFESVITIVYEMQLNGTENERIMIQYCTKLADEAYDIGAEGFFWTQRPFPEESYILEKDGVKYYIAKWTGLGGTILLWGVDWVNEDGYIMNANFPYRFTAEEVLEFISDLERVEIG